MNLRFFRQERALTQIELAKITGIPRYRIQLMEQQIIAITPLDEKIFAQALGLSISLKGGQKWALKQNSN